MTKKSESEPEQITCWRAADLVRQENADPYGGRVIGRAQMPDGGLVSTARVYDGARPYETLISSPDYHCDVRKLSDATVVETYDDAEAAAAGHQRWTSSYRAGTLPDPLVNVENARDPVGCTTLPATPKRVAVPCMACNGEGWGPLEPLAQGYDFVTGEALPPQHGRLQCKECHGTGAVRTTASSAAETDQASSE